MTRNRSSCQTRFDTCVAAQPSGIRWGVSWNLCVLWSRQEMVRYVTLGQANMIVRSWARPRGSWMVGFATRGPAVGLYQQVGPKPRGSQRQEEAENVSWTGGKHPYECPQSAPTNGTAHYEYPVLSVYLANKHQPYHQGKKGDATATLAFSFARTLDDHCILKRDGIFLGPDSNNTRRRGIQFQGSSS